MRDMLENISEKLLETQIPHAQIWQIPSKNQKTTTREAQK
jgi:hypothetical protein